MVIKRVVMRRELSYKITNPSGTTSMYREKTRRNPVEVYKIRKGTEKEIWAPLSPSLAE